MGQRLYLSVCACVKAENGNNGNGEVLRESLAGAVNYYNKKNLKVNMGFLCFCCW